MKKVLFLFVALMLTACATAQYRFNIVINKSSPLFYANGAGAQLRLYNTTLTEGSGTVTLNGGNFSTGTYSLLGTGSVGTTGAGKRSKVWAVDAEFTNPPTINGVSTATLYAPKIAPVFTSGITTDVITLGSTLISTTGPQFNYLNTLTSNVQTQIDAKQATLVSGTTLKTVAGITLLGSGDIPIAGTGTVTSVAVTTANGVSASIVNPTSAATMTFSLGAITPTSVNSVVISGSTTPTLAVTGTSSISGVNTGNNAINTLYSGLVTNANHTGDVTGSGALTIANSAVSLAKMANVATSTVFYRKSGATGAPEVQTLATLKTDLLLTGTNTGDQTSVTGNAGTATILQTSRNINGIAFNGSASVTVPSNITPSTAGNVMTSTGSVWSSVTPPDTVSLAAAVTEFNSKTTSYTLLLTDVGKMIIMDSGSATNITIPPNSSVAFTIGQRLEVTSIGAGIVTILGGSGVNIRSLNAMTKLSGQYAKVELIKIATNSWLVTGQLSL